jgi:hypothetical protein
MLASASSVWAADVNTGLPANPRNFALPSRATGSNKGASSSTKRVQRNAHAAEAQVACVYSTRGARCSIDTPFLWRALRVAFQAGALSSSASHSRRCADTPSRRSISGGSSAASSSADAALLTSMWRVMPRSRTPQISMAGSEK